MSPLFAFEAVLDAGASLFSPALDTYADVLRKLVTQRDDLSRLEQTDAVTQVQPRRQIFTDGESRAADEVILLDACLVEPETGADALGDESGARAAQRMPCRVERSLRTAARAADILQRATRDQV